MNLGMTIGLWVVASVLTLVVFVALFRTKRPVRSLVGSGVQGLCALAAVNVTGMLTGVSIGLNALSGVCCLLLGIPGVITLLLLKTIFGV